MKLIQRECDAEAAYLVPIGDIHWGEQGFTKIGLEKLKGYRSWIEDTPEAFTFLLGDLGTVATRNSKTSPFEVNPREFEELVEFFLPIKDRILGAIDGNHEQRQKDFLGYSPLVPFCHALGIAYCGYSAVVHLRVGKRPDRRNEFRQQYFLYFHHTTGGGSSVGSALNRVEKLTEIIEGMDVYCGGHNHQLVTGVRNILRPIGTGVQERRVHFVCCGSYLAWDGQYSEMKQYALSKLGSPRIRLSGEQNHHDVHISI